MSLGANLSSGYTQQLIENSKYCKIAKLLSVAYSDPCCNNPGFTDSTNTPAVTASASQPSMLLLGSPCRRLPTPAELNQFPKVAVPSSVRLQHKISVCTDSISPENRFAQYRRYQAPAVCPPLNQSANMAGKSLPSSLECNIYPIT